MKLSIEAKQCRLYVYIKTKIIKDKNKGINNIKKKGLICNEILEDFPAMALLLIGKILSHIVTIVCLAPSHFPGPVSRYWNGRRGPKKHCQARDGSENSIFPGKKKNKWVTKAVGQVV